MERPTRLPRTMRMTIHARRARSRGLWALAVSLLIAGCAVPSPTVPLPGGAPDTSSYEDLPTTATEKVTNADGSLSMIFDATAQGGVGGLLAEHKEGAAIGTFAVNERVGYAELVFEYEYDPTTSPEIAGVLLDEDSRILCAAFVDAPCTAPAYAPADWTVDWRPALGVVAPGTPLRAIVTLHPPSHMLVGDPLAGVDTTIRFRVSDTGAQGGEDNIGVMADGTILTQKTLATMRSRDDGETWEDVAPPLNRQRTFDPMLFVDPTRNVVYVDHNYIACSQLSWSSDAGRTWLQNPAACGRPENDHQKVASGPNPTGLPVPAVYYSYSTPGVWVSRSLDGGFSFTTYPVAGVIDGRDPANTGPIWADELGNVYIPMYMCDGEGYIGVGVSHDYGLTWKFVVAAEDPGTCYDVDPGLWADTEGTVYLAYHRPDGVKYVHSKDAGETWSAPVVVSPPTLLSFVHVDAVAGDAGRLAIAYRATPDTRKAPDLADGWAAWHLYVTFVENATTSTPSIRTALVNDPNDPIQRGPICTDGLFCYAGTRNLLDFIDIAVGPDGRVYPSYSDGCDVTCPTPADSRGTLGLVGIQIDGPRLFMDRAPWAR